MVMASSRSPHPLRRVASIGAVLALVALVVVVQLWVRSDRSSSEAAPAEDVAAGTTAQYAPPADRPLTEMVDPDPADPALRAMADDDAAQEKAASAAVDGRRAPFLTRDGVRVGAPSTLVVPARGRPYGLAELARLVPSAFEHGIDGSLVLTHPLVVAEGAEVVVDSHEVPSLRLASGDSGNVWIRTVNSSITFRGHVDAPLTVSSWDPVAAGPDTDRTDGRAYVVSRGGRLDLEHTDVTWLGFASTGITSGVAWVASGDRPGAGGAVDSSFSHNYFGAYSAGAVGLQIIRSAFTDNVVYGFDPHTATNETLVASSVAARNGRHGFIFSEGCQRNVIRDSESYLNGGDGFVIDDGTPQHGQGRDSDDNTLIGVSSHDNGRVGVVIEGGTGNSVQDATVVNNRDGIWVRNQATDTSVVDSRVLASAGAGLRLGEGLGPTEVRGNEIEGAATGVLSEGGSATRLVGVHVAGATTGMSLRGDQSRATFEDVVVADGGSRALVVTGAPLVPEAAAGIRLPSQTVVSSTSTSWSPAALLHKALVSLWLLILLVPLGAVLVGAVSRRLRASAA